jgi:hypothetical protein
VIAHAPVDVNREPLKARPRQVGDARFVAVRLSARAFAAATPGWKLHHQLLHDFDLA